MVPRAVTCNISMLRFARGAMDTARRTAFSRFVFTAFITKVEPSLMLRTRIFETRLRDHRKAASAGSALAEARG